MTAPCLDWSGAEHWSPRRRDCIHCKAPTNLRNSAGRPSHKACAERVIAALRQPQPATTIQEAS